MVPQVGVEAGRFRRVLTEKGWPLCLEERDRGRLAAEPCRTVFKTSSSPRAESSGAVLSPAALNLLVATNLIAFCNKSLWGTSVLDLRRPNDHRPGLRRGSLGADGDLDVRAVP
jgi:hypothetical protein